MSDKIRLLVAEHNHVFREGMCRLFADENDLEVVAKTDKADEAIKLAAELKPDVALMDTHILGVKTVKHAKDACPSMAVIILASTDWESFVIDSVRQGAAGYLLKDLPVPELLDAIRTVHAGKVLFDIKSATHIMRRIASKDRKLGDAFEHLNSRELEILRLAANGMHNKEISGQLFISERTVQSHLVNIFRKLGVTSRTAAVVHALKEGLLDSA